MHARHLVTTADERTWPPGRPLLFLGGWCQRWERRTVWGERDIQVAAPYGLGRLQKDADRTEVRALEALLFPELSKVLARHHDIDHDERYWRIILGHWFRRCVDVVYNRMRCLQQCLAQHAIAATTVLADDNYHLAPQDSNAAIWASNDDRWNHALYASLLANLADRDFPLEIISDESGETGYRQSDIVFPVSGMRARLRALAVSLSRIGARWLQSQEDIFILNSYLPRQKELQLQLLLGQLPQLIGSAPAVKPIQPDATLRHTLGQAFAGGKPGTFEAMLRMLVFELLPVCFLESFSGVRSTALRQFWPQKPRAVFTSNNFDTDEVFKIWLAEKVMQGTSYVVGQHGNNYGTHRYYVHPSIEEVTSDRFLTWGWTDGLPQHAPAFLLKTTGRQPVRANPAGDLLLIELGVPHRLNTWDETAEFASYFEEQKRFVLALSAAPAQLLRLRLYHVRRQAGWGELERWSEFNAALRIDDGAQPIEALISASRLVVHSYDSTGILETLAQDIPTLAFWQNGLDEVRDSAKPYYQLLVDVGIFHLSPESAAAHINAIWSDIPSWWYRPDVVAARAEFCWRYARTCAHPLREMRTLLRSAKSIHPLTQVAKASS